MLPVSCGAETVTAPDQQQQTAVATAVQSNTMGRHDLADSQAQILSFESGSDTELAANATTDAAAGSWFKLYDASFDDEHDAPAVEDLVAELVSPRHPFYFT